MPRVANVTNIELHTIPLGQQISLVRDNEIMLSVNGAGVGVLVFARAGTVVVNMYPSERSDTPFQQMFRVWAAQQMFCYLQWECESQSCRHRPDGINTDRDADLILTPKRLVGIMNQALDSVGFSHCHTRGWNAFEIA